MKEISRKYEKKENGKYVETYFSNDVQYVNECFMKVLRAKYIYVVPNIKRIVRTPNYDGTETYQVYYENGRETFVIKD